MSHNIFGCDLSMDRIDVYDRSKGKDFGVPNTPAGVASFVHSLPPDATVVFEATSGCDRLLMRCLDKAAVRYHRVNPRRAREFARAQGVLAKTDRVDARVLADMAAQLNLRVTTPTDPVRAKLAEMLLRRRQLIEIKKAEACRLRTLEVPNLVAGIHALIKMVEAQIADCDELIETLIKSDPELAAADQRLRAVPGVGVVTSTTLIACLPELGAVDRRAIAALAGLAPLSRDSGKFRGQRRIWGGRRHVREAPYMASLSASRWIPRFRDMRDRMRAKGKKPKTILIAIARRLLVTLNAMFRDNSEFIIIP